MLFGLVRFRTVLVAFHSSMHAMCCHIFFSVALHSVDDENTRDKNYFTTLTEFRWFVYEFYAVNEFQHYGNIICGTTRSLVLAPMMHHVFRLCCLCCLCSRSMEWCKLCQKMSGIRARNVLQKCTERRIARKAAKTWRNPLVKCFRFKKNMRFCVSFALAWH